MNNTSHKGQVRGVSGGSTYANADHSEARWLFSPNIGCFQQGYFEHMAQSQAYVQYPAGLTVASTISSQASSSCASGDRGWDRWLRWQVLNQVGGPISLANMSFYDTISAQGASACNLQGNGNGCWLTTFFTGNGYTNSQGQFRDHYYFCSSCCNCTTSADQWYYVDSVPIEKTISYTCSGITISGQ